MIHRRCLECATVLHLNQDFCNQSCQSKYYEYLRENEWNWY